MQLSSESRAEILPLINRVHGQVGGIIRMLEEGRDCTDMVVQIAAASKALDKIGFKLLAANLRSCLADTDGAHEDDEKTLERLFMTLA